ncbi:MAG: hypothetical protein KZQ93_05645 [Candidatus Thiodiazotropha sp. (ex Monitilora ramsayi)]|nr:hypothetical protein [Candidatus Thiodiazotropha sp. (ex Monitilora ramsayi)]
MYKSDSGFPVGISANIQCFEERERPENEAAQECERHKGPIMWRGEMQTGYTVGPYVLKAPEDTIKIEFQHSPPLKGEIDIMIFVGCDEELPRKELIEFAKPALHSLISQINITLDEYLVPTTPLSLRKLSNEGSSFINTTTISVRSRPSISSQNIEDILYSFVAQRQNNNTESTRQLDLAMNRYLSAMTEEDPVDKYCDLWESCEFSTLGIKAKGNVVSRISTCLASHISNTKQKVGKSRMENRLEIRSIYQTRKDIVHNAIENPAEIDRKIELLSEIACELIKYRLGIPWGGNRILEERIAEHEI